MNIQQEHELEKALIGLLKLAQVDKIKEENIYSILGLQRIPKIGEVDNKNRTLVFHDEFNGNYINPDNWNIKTGKINALSRDACLTDLPKNISINNNCLEITATNGPFCDDRYDTAALSSENLRFFRYGRIEARIKVPTGKGTFWAFWMMPQFSIYGKTPPWNWKWPGNGEIDIGEGVSQFSKRVHGGVHFVKDNKKDNDSGTFNKEDDLSDDFHVYAIEWGKYSIKWFIDEYQYHEFDISVPVDGRLPFQEEFFLLLNLAIGGNWAESPDPDVYPQTMYVDWIRVWN